VSSDGYGEIRYDIDVKKRFLTFFLFWSRFFTFLTFILFSKRFLFKKNVGKVQSGKQITRSNEIDLNNRILYPVIRM